MTASLKHFILRSTALKLYRDLCKIACKLPASEYKEVKALIRNEYKRYHDETNLEVLEDALQVGSLQLKKLKDTVGNIYN
ncbi:hypothetical protein GUITHDRAFT_115204 [Guillardia theta CCMP2712]|uniref:Complex 1 LYR protein domain-containing protein n=1 Tax=Guillardia theta (strain CCMP2712) TaxID=905079 RepID=L1IQU6_GUITC|nr:hypothetical protein GUITHDRAFT_115204 [Guillardia theta CCMP2712]EKX38656.1 hypothetical protein GUITHDRAFT_115204 [Guillardia theta CCMP2712]|mmetsp:Transcript_30903/g.99275  ORF Transcript_30903/g.99275 Transcript_30903/m.99275 type:complete len:80 (-) Transcript_30903:455-694(-)|eukprot:XP_005825636.1 hypothetical protein GUITHDRAFT_115204 [Guillardia theta CCMP2712]